MVTPRLTNPIVRLAVTASCVFVMSACVSVSRTLLMDRTAFPVPSVQVRVALATDEIPEKCERIALLFGTGHANFTDDADVVNKLREETGILGGNLVQIQNLEDADLGERLTGIPSRDGDAIAFYCPAE